MWSNPQCPPWDDGRAVRLPAFRPAAAPTRDVGAVPGWLRTFPGAARSGQPEYSFAAWCADADGVLADHGSTSGPGTDRRVRRYRTVAARCCRTASGLCSRTRTAPSTEGVGALGDDFERAVGNAAGMVGGWTAALLEQAALVDFGVEWQEASP